MHTKQEMIWNFKQARPNRWEAENELPMYRLETCGICCALMLLELYGRTQYPTPKQKHKLYDLYRWKSFKGTTGPALAKLLAWNGLRVRLLQSFRNLPENRDGYFSPELYELLKQEWQNWTAACGENVQIETCPDLSCDTLKQELDKGRQAIVQILVPGNADGIHDHTLHWVVVYGFRGDTFLVCDPNSTKRHLSREEMEAYMDTPIGRIFLTVEEGTDCTTLD